MRMGGWTPKHPLRGLLGVPNTDPHKVFGGFWKTNGSKKNFPSLFGQTGLCLANEQMDDLVPEAGWHQRALLFFRTPIFSPFGLFGELVGS